MHRKPDLSDEEWRRAHAILARLVVKYGDQFLPHFEALDREIAKRDAKAEIRAKAEAVALNLIRR